MALRRIQSGMVSRYADLNFNTGTLFGNLSVSGSISAANFSGISGTSGGSNIITSVYPYQTFNGDGTTTTFTLLSAVASVNDIIVFVSGVYQNKSTFYLSNNYTLVFYNPPPNGSEMVEVQYVRGALYNYQTSIPADGTVIESKLADNSVSTSKIINGSVTFEKLSSIYAFIPVQSLTGTGIDTAFTLLSAVANVNEIMVYVSGVYQNKNSYTISPNPTTITFSEAPPSGTEIEISYLRSVPYTTFIPQEYSIVNSQLTDNVITTNKIVAGAVTSDKTNFGNLGVSGSLTVAQNLCAYGSRVYLTGTVTAVNRISAVNFGTSPVVEVEQRIPTTFPAVRVSGNVTVTGSVSTTGSITYAGGVLDVFRGNTGISSGTTGTPPAPSAGDLSKVFTSDGNWYSQDHIIPNRVRSVGQVLGFAILSGGRGYTSRPTVRIDPPTEDAILGDGRGDILTTYRITASAEAVLSGGTIVDFRIIHPGAGYTYYADVSGIFGSTQPLGKAPPTRMTITGGGGTGAIAHPLISNNGLPNSDSGGAGSDGYEQSYSMFLMRDNSIVALGYGNNYGGTGSLNNAGAWGYLECTSIPVRWTDAIGLYGETYWPIPVRLYTGQNTAYFIDQRGWLWFQGYNGNGQGGVGDTTSNSFFRRIPPAYFNNSPIIKFKMSSSGNGVYITCGAITARGRYYQWGYNSKGQLGNGNTTSQNIPFYNTSFPELAEATWLSNPETLGSNNVIDFCYNGGYDHVANCVLLGNLTFYSAGYNNYSQFAIGNNTDYSSHQQGYFNSTTIANNITVLRGGCAPATYNNQWWLSANGRFMGLGYNNNAQLVIGNTTSSSNARLENGLTSNQPNPNIAGQYPSQIVIRGGGSTSSVYFLLDNNQLWVGGYNGYGELGNSNTSNQSSFVLSNLNSFKGSALIRKIVHAKGDDRATAIALLNDGRIFSTGYNGYGNAGLGNNGVSNIQEWQIVPLHRRDIVDIGYQGHSNVYTPMALCSDGNVYAWGGNEQSQIGLNGMNSVIYPTKMRFPG